MFFGECKTANAQPAEAVQPMATDWPVWRSINADDPLTQTLALTGVDLHWDAPAALGTTRLFLSNHPEVIITTTPEGKLWCEESNVADDAVTYRLFFQHYNFQPAAIYFGVVVEHLAGEGEITLSGMATVTRATVNDTPRNTLMAMMRVGERNAYAELRLCEIISAQLFLRIFRVCCRGSSESV